MYISIYNQIAGPGAFVPSSRGFPDRGLLGRPGAFAVASRRRQTIQDAPESSPSRPKSLPGPHKRAQEASGRPQDAVFGGFFADLGEIWKIWIGFLEPSCYQKRIKNRCQL